MIKKLTLALLIFNISLISIIGALMLIYGSYDYGVGPLIDIALNLLGLDPNGQAMNTINGIAGIFILIPNALDWFVLAIFLGFIFNLIYFSIMSKKISEIVFFGTILIYIPLFLWFISKVDEITKSIIGSLSKSLIAIPDMTFYNFITNNSLAITAIIFVLCLGINVIDWNIVRNKLFSKSNDEDLFGE